MTREEAIKWLETFKTHTGMAELSKAFDVAIKALEQEPCEDAISRAEALEILIDNAENGYVDIEEVKLVFSELEREPCEDAISRAEAIRISEEIHVTKEGDKNEHERKHGVFKHNQL